MNKMKKPTLRQMMEEHKNADAIAFAQIPNKQDLEKVVRDTVDETINGKLLDLKQQQIEIKTHLSNQDVNIKWLIWIGGGIGTAIIGLIISKL